MSEYRAQANMRGREIWLDRWGLSLIMPAPVHRLGVRGQLLIKLFQLAEALQISGVMFMCTLSMNAAITVSVLKQREMTVIGNGDQQTIA
jgi:hypothetical protein